MMDLSNLLRQNVRTPPPLEIARAFKDFFAHKRTDRNPVEELQAAIVTTAFKYLQDKGREIEGFGLSLEDLEIALKVLVWVAKEENQRRKELARLLFEEFKQRSDSQGGESIELKFLGSPLTHYIRILTQCGESLAARELLLRYQKSFSGVHELSNWERVRKGFAKEKNETELQRTIEIMKENGAIYDAAAHEANTMSHIAMGDFETAKKWYMHPIAGNALPTSRTNISMLKLCILRGEFEWGQPIFESVLEKGPDKESWDIIFQWAAAKGKGVDEIERMMEVMVRKNDEQGNEERPDIDSINGLVDLANGMNDSYTAERYMALAQKWSIQPNGRTYLLQFNYRLKIGDIDGARSAYTQLQAHEMPDQEDMQLLNKLIVALCKAKRLDHALIMQYAEDLSERRARFEPETVAALCRLHLARDELHDVLDLLKVHTFHYDMIERNSIREVFVEFCLDRSNSLSRIWDAYSIARQIFNEMNRNIRLRLMNEFFARGRSDMATHVFGHMRQQPLKETRPDSNAYTQCFEGIAKSQDYDSLEIVHNMLKLDSEVEPDTRVYNGLMLAYEACGEPYRSLEFWDDIQYSREGPTYSSIRIALRACETSPYGDQQAREIWGKLKKFEIEVTKDIYQAYICALAGQGLSKEAITLMTDMENEIGSQPDVST